MKVRVDLKMLCLVSAVAASLASAPSGAAQSTGGSSQAGSGPLAAGSFINLNTLPAQFGGALQALGGRMTNANNASTTFSGTITDDSGSRQAQITVQAPGLLRFQDSASSRVLTFNGNQFQSKNGSGQQNDQRVEESLMANLPDTIFLQLAAGGGLRRIGGGFRTDDGKNPNYTGPYWLLYAFSPRPRPGMTAGQPLQQPIFIAIDEQTGLLAEVRMVANSGKPNQQVTQTQFQNWFQQGGQWFPRTIIRLENAKQVLSFQVQQAGVGGQSPATSFQP
jgi:hypothetical protein